MRRIWLAIKVFFLTLFNGDVARAVDTLLGERAAPVAAPKAEPAAREAPRQPPAPKPPVRSEALTLLSALQREARLVDFLMESLAGYSDDQVGAVARDVHRDCGKVLERVFALKPATDQAEGATVEVPAGFDPLRYRLVGNVSGAPPFGGRLVHPGWEASKCELPGWTGSAAAARVVAPIEVEL